MAKIVNNRLKEKKRREEGRNKDENTTGVHRKCHSRYV